LVLTFLALGFAIYNNFIKDKTKKAPAPKNIVAQSVNPVTKKAPKAVAQQDADARLSGVSKGDAERVAEVLPPEVAKLKEEGENLFFEGDFDGALVKFALALQKKPKSAELLNSMGLAYKKKDDLKKASQFYKRAIGVNPKCLECLNNLGVLQVAQGNYISAVFHFQKAIEISSTYADPYFNLGILMEKEGSLKSAMDSYVKFLEYTKTEDDNLKEQVKRRIESLALELGE